ncbi:hypothetical protein [Aquamicrobium sp. LC103]|uniref:hypothetical protein n=1 Tax=Aquamicrobium sp. LC103 TaxID=1120658 RepID=UPI00063EBEC4|nr:hypothetical protein [Aquamicrobium sp. LC103]TKT75342.1 fimbrial protein [Aquamicrobium sp. LC103]
MAGPALDDEEQEKPLDPAVENVRRKLIRFMVINLGVLFIALMAVVAAIVYRTATRETPSAEAASQVPSPAESPAAAGEIALPAGARILGQALSGNRLSLQVELASGRQAIFIYDTVERRILGRFEVVEE